MLFFVLLGLAVAILYSRYVTPVFESEALIQVNDKSQGISGLGENISKLIEEEDSKSQAETELIKSRMVLDPVVNLLHLQIRLSDPTISSVDRITKDRIDTQVNTTAGAALETENGRAQVTQFDVAPDYLDQSFTLVRSATGFILSNNLDEFKVS